MSELPSGWAMASLNQVAAFVADGDHNPPRRVREGVPRIYTSSECERRPPST